MTGGQMTRSGLKVNLSGERMLIPKATKTFVADTIDLKKVEQGSQITVQEYNQRLLQANS